LIDELLAEQQRLTAVDHFSRQHALNGSSTQAKFYRDLIPLNQPRAGEQYAFEVDLDKCSGCKACVSACHSLNGLDDDEMWRSVGLLVGVQASDCSGSTYRANSQKPEFQRQDSDFGLRTSDFGLLQHITTACHHCVDPGCLNGCPVLAYDKDPLTGIVRHLDDQCIGCQYCVMKCPYDVPQYSKARGIVRKCDMCHSRLVVGEAPACVQACPGEAIRITVVDRKEATAKYRECKSETRSSKLEGNSKFEVRNSDFGFLPDSPAPRITLPTTRYVSRKPLPSNLLAGDHSRICASPAHLPLVFMLVLTQMAVGASVAAVFLEPSKWLSFLSVTVGAFGLAVASLHLGKPLKAWRSFLGWRTSWFSREVIALSAFVSLAGISLLLPDHNVWSSALNILTAAAGVAGVACSAMIYADTRREFWSASQCFARFFGTTLILGAMTALCVQAFTFTASNSVFISLLLFRVAASAAKFAFERQIFRHWVDENTVVLTPLNRTARLLDGPLGLAWRLRVACGLLGNIVLPVSILANVGGSGMLPWTLASLAVCLVGELLERYLFFSAVAPAKMPGGIAP
jgi:Fe-S-cluster-containing dehydrogenase component/DMSO reductase anchor subunit